MRVLSQYLLTKDMYREYNGAQIGNCHLTTEFRPQTEGGVTGRGKMKNKIALRKFIRSAEN